ncbi:SDR family NAD(P)-dependent oxidoreductase [Pseudonocardia sp. RS11V-5]|uniref:SDR family NAD(P)-dependent oxidoreductase n=1 Tax=Pseudonocardia terrae TaxID=2905831 RepID=UPI001E5A9807|nr:SDR family NAD(P)-dependent oxidoreductase [Pseudonocardia terrae]MCE3555367.1 SDR family NAD(P)-dependent oxidoreductase [Pseudonocardia terrae]
MEIAGSVVVVTGASSGIGRATALALLQRGATVVGVARDAGALSELAGRGLVPAPADVTDFAAVEGVVRETTERFGRVDAWVNCAGVIQFGAFLDVPLDDVRRVLDVDLMGYVHGCRAVLPGMVERDHGVIVNVASILGIVALPYGAAYSMAKFAIRALAVSLRQELRTSGVRGVRVGTVLPAAIDTPIWRDAANHSGARPRLAAPTYSPERVARTILNQIRRPRREVVAGGMLGRLLLLQHKVWPESAERLFAAEVGRYVLVRGGGPVDDPGNLYDPPDRPRRVHDGWNGLRRERARRLAAGLGLAAAVGAAVGLARR